MAVVLIASNLVWQQVLKYTAGAHPAIRAAFRDLKLHLSQQSRNPDLQVFPFTEAQADAAGGTVLLSGACKIYGAYIKKEATGTDNFAWIYDDATDDTTAANARISFPLLLSSEEQVFIDPVGLPIATGIVVTQYTGPLGTTDGSNGGDGFIIVGAA
jgi:hypothetical protein